MSLLEFVDTSNTVQVKLGRLAAQRFVFGATLVSTILAGAASGQMQSPRYQSPIGINAPTPQVKLPVPEARTPGGTVVEDVIVRVNDQIIDRGDLERGEKQLQEDAAQQNVPPAELANREKQLLRDMIDQQLLLSRGKELALNVDAQVVLQLNDIRKKNDMATMEDLEKAVRQSGIAFEDFRANIKNSIITQAVVRDEVQRKIQPTARQEQTYYDAHKQEFEQPEQVRLSEILIPTPADANDAAVAEAQTKASDVAAKLAAGAKFEDLAKQYSGGQTADKGGDLGLFKRGALAKVLEDKTFPLKAGESTAPIRTRQGFVVLKVTAHVDAGVPPMKDVEEQVQEGLYRESIQPALRAYLTGLRENAFIDIAPGFVDTGASPKETKPVFSAYTAPAVKKKKVVQKQRLNGATTPAPGAVVAGGTAGTTSATGGAPAAATSTKPGMATMKTVSTGKKAKKVKREKIRFGQAPRTGLPSGTEQAAVTSGTDTGTGAAAVPTASTGTPGGTNVAAVDDTPAPPAARKTRFSDRESTIVAAKAATKTAKANEKIAAKPAAMTQTEIAAQQTQAAPLGLSGDTATKKKKKKVKGAPKERLQDTTPAPKTAPEMTPVPPKSVRDNGEPVVSPKPAADGTAPTADKTTLPPVTAPAPGSLSPNPTTGAPPGTPQ